MGTTACLLSFALALPPALPGVDEPAPPALSGRWTLDPARSDDARQKLRDARPADGSGRGGARGGGPGGGGPGGPGGGRRGGGGPGGAGGGFGDSLRSLMEAPPGLTITQGADEITVIEEEGRFRAFHPDRKEYKGTSGERITTRWEGAQLVVETRSERGPRLVETFTASADELIAELRIDGGRGEPLSVRRVYRKVPAE